MALCQQIALQLSPEARQTAPAFSSLANRIFLAYFPSLPAKPAADLWRYCIATRILFRTWVRHKEDAGKGFMEKRVEEVGGAAREELEHLVAREGWALKTLVRKI